MEACSSKSSLHLHSPLRTIPKLRLCASISSDDVASGRCHVTDQHVQIEGKNYSKAYFDNVFSPGATQEDMYSAFLADTIKSVFAGNDATVLAMGAKSNGKDERLYGNSVSRNGLVQMAISQMMSALDENKNPEERIQVRMSAIMVSQKDPTVVDLLSMFNPDPRHRVVKLVDDRAGSGAFIDNESEIRVETIDQALFYLNTAVDHRMIQDEQHHRISHVLISISLYSYKMNDKMEGGRRRLCFLDMGIGERNSTNGGMTMPALGSILMAMVQRNKHIPFRDSSVCQLIRCALGSSRFTTFVFSLGAKNDDNENIGHLAYKISRSRSKNIGVHGRKPSGTTGTLDSNASSSSCGTTTITPGGTPRTPRRFELESGSELSAAETVIFVGPGSSRTASPASTTMPSTPTSIRPLHRTTRNHSGAAEALSKPLSVETKTSPTHNCHDGCIHSIPPMLRGHTPFLSASLKLYDELCSPPSSSRTSPVPPPTAFGGKTAENREDFGIMIAQPSIPLMKTKSKYNLDDGKMKQIMQWMETSEAPPILFSSPCYENSATSVEELRECVGILSHPLEDIIEQEEESMRTSTATTGGSKKDHPLRILSKQDLNIEPEAKEKQEENELDLVMAASLSSMRSHDILAKLEAMRNANANCNLNGNSQSNTDMDVSEMDVYRRASHLEEYAMQRVREIEENKMKNKKKVKLGLNCCQQQSMISSGSTVVDWSQIEKKKEKEREAQEEEKRKDMLRERRAKLKITELEIKRERNLIDKELDDKKGIANSIARQLQHFSLSPCRGGRTHRSVSTHRIDPPNASLPSTPTMSHKKMIGGSLAKLSASGASASSSMAPSSPALGYHQSLPRHSKLPTSVNGRRASAERDRSQKSSKSSKSLRRSSGSREELQWRSPYAQMTSPKAYGGPGTSSSGRGSSAPGSDFETPVVTTNDKSVNGTMPRSKRQSYSASSGYESANDYHIYSTTNKKANILDKKRNEEKLLMVRQADEIRHRQRQLKKELEEAKRAIGQEDDARMIANSSDQRLNGLSRTTMIDAMLQENRILEKRLVACRNHSMLVTTFI